MVVDNRQNSLEPTAWWTEKELLDFTVKLDYLVDSFGECKSQPAYVYVTIIN